MAAAIKVLPALLPQPEQARCGQQAGSVLTRRAGLPPCQARWEARQQAQLSQRAATLRGMRERGDTFALCVALRLDYMRQAGDITNKCAGCGRRAAARVQPGWWGPPSAACMPIMLLRVGFRAPPPPMHPAAQPPTAHRPCLPTHPRPHAARPAAGRRRQRLTPPPSSARAAAPCSRQRGAAPWCRLRCRTTLTRSRSAWHSFPAARVSARASAPLAIPLPVLEQRPGPRQEACGCRCVR